jgi:hypothetical protein
MHDDVLVDGSLGIAIERRTSVPVRNQDGDGLLIAGFRISHMVCERLSPTEPQPAVHRGLHASLDISRRIFSDTREPFARVPRRRLQVSVGCTRSVVPGSSGREASFWNGPVLLQVGQIFVLCWGCISYS